MCARDKANESASCVVQGSELVGPIEHARIFNAMMAISTEVNRFLEKMKELEENCCAEGRFSIADVFRSYKISIYSR